MDDRDTVRLCQRHQQQGFDLLFNPSNALIMENGHGTHLRLIRERLLSGGSITALEALREFGCYRLASRISDLKREGLNITKTTEESVSAVTGKPVRYARYFLSNNSNKQQRPKLSEGI